MVIDINKCNGCYNCFLSCKDEYSGNDYPPFSLALPETAKPWMVVKEVERGKCPKVKVDYVPIPCQQCSHPACIEKSPEGTVYIRARLYAGAWIGRGDRPVGRAGVK
jgi:Fe-S-cluster-containing dehydrogenase component